MRSGSVVLGVVVVTGLLSGSSLAVPLQVYSVDGPQDPLALNGWVDELGNKPAFPDDKWITSQQVTWGGHIPCPADYGGGGCVQVRITNMTGLSFPEVYYVIDGSATSDNGWLTNYDGWIGNSRYYPDDRHKAFKIDAVGVNTPLVYESMTPDGVFQPGETWEFVIQEFQTTNPVGGSPAAFGSCGIGFTSMGGYDGSTGSILVPEPASLALLALGGLGLLRRRPA